MFDDDDIHFGIYRNFCIISLFFLISDVPGALATITATLAEAGVNIGNCHLGRERGDCPIQGSALAVFYIDGECPKDLADKVKSIEAVRVCKILTV